MPLLRLLKYLDQEMVQYTVIVHPSAFTAQKTAAAAHVPGREVAKTVMVKLDGQLAMAVLPADASVDLEHMRDAIGVSRCELASELEFKDRFPGCEAGAMPPLGNLFGVPVFVADGFVRTKHIVFNAGNHREMVRLRYQDFARLTQARVLDLVRHAV